MSDPEEDSKLLRENSLRLATKHKMTDKPKAARLANLERGRKKRMEFLKQKKDKEKEPKQVEYDLNSNSSSSMSSSDESDNDTFIISKRPKKGGLGSARKVEASHKKQKSEKGEDFNSIRSDVDELKNMIFDLASLQKKQNKRSSQKRKGGRSGGTKIVVLPQNSSPNQSQNKVNDSVLEALRKSLM